MQTLNSGPRRVVAASAIGMAFGLSAIGVGSFGVFVVPLTEAFGWGRGDMSIALTIMSLTIVVLSPIAGTLIDRFGVRAVLVPATISFGFAVGAMSLLTADIRHFYAMYFFIGVAGVCTSPASYSRIIVAWFDKHRGLALGIALAGIGLGTAFIPPFVQQVSAANGWRYGYLGLAALVLFVSLPTISLWLAPPKATAASGQGQEAGFDFAHAVRTWPFFALAISFVLLGVFTAGVLAHLVPLLTDHGVSPPEAASIASVLGIALIAGRLLTGFLLDRIFAPIVVVGFLLGPVVGLVLLLSGATGPIAILAVVLIGLGLGAEMDFMSYLVSRYFGLRAFGRIYGLIYAALTIGLSAGPLVMGYSQQLTGSYDFALKVLLGAAVLAIVPLTTLGRYPTFASEK